jgi:hypothetical protein
MKMNKSKNILPATVKKIKVEEPGKKRGINTKGLVVVGIMIAAAVLAAGAYFGVQAYTDSVNDAWGRALEADIEFYSRGKIDVLDVRKDETKRGMLELFLTPTGDVFLTEAEFESVDDTIRQHLSTTNAEIVAYLWAARNQSGDMKIVSITVCLIESILDKTPQCQTQYGEREYKERNLRWQGITKQ